jgi:hypothetical protein
MLVNDTFLLVELRILAFSLLMNTTFLFEAMLFGFHSAYEHHFSLWGYAFWLSSYL